MPALKDNDLKVKYIIRNFDRYRGFLQRLNILLNWQFNMPTAINRLVIPAKAGIQYFHRIPGFRLSPRIKSGVRPE